MAAGTAFGRRMILCLMCQLWLSTASCNDRSCPHLHPSVQVNAWLSSSPPPVSSALTATFFIVCCLRLGATREAARQEREERKEKCKKDKDGAGREGGGTAVGGVADSGVPTIVVINAGLARKNLTHVYESTTGASTGSRVTAMCRAQATQLRCDLFDCVMSLECDKPRKLFEYRGHELALLAALDVGMLREQHVLDILAMALCRRYRAAAFSSAPSRPRSHGTACPAQNMRPVLPVPACRCSVMALAARTRCSK